MALGNANTSAQARGKSKAVKVRRAKKVKIARNYHGYISSTVQSRSTCGGEFDYTEKMYHNGSALKPAPGDLIYTSKRADAKRYAEPGHYKTVISSRAINVEVGANGVCAGITTCGR